MLQSLDGEMDIMQEWLSINKGRLSSAQELLDRHAAKVKSFEASIASVKTFMTTNIRELKKVEENL